MNNHISDAIAEYLKYWKWFLLSVVGFIVLAFVYLRYATPQYAIQSKIKILDEKSGSSELANFKELNLFAGVEQKVEDEIEILNSRSNFIDVVGKLKLNSSIHKLGDLKQTELYNNSPFKINFIKTPDSIIYNSDFECFIVVKSESSFDYSSEDRNYKTYQFGENIKTPIGDIVVLPDLGLIKNELRSKFIYRLTPISKAAQDYKNNVFVSKVDKFSNVLALSIQDPIPSKAVDILNALMDVYNENAVTDRKEIADKTSKFIDDRITDIASNLSSADKDAQEFKTSKGLTDISSQSNINLNIGASNQRELQEMSTQLNIASQMKDYVDSKQAHEVLPSNIGLSDPSIANTTAKYNQLVQERDRLLKSSNERNPIIVNIDQELSGLKTSLKSSLNNVESNLSLMVNSLSQQQNQIQSRIYSAPRNEKLLRDITRKQETTEALYLYLLQKREEAQISAASASPKSKIIDRAYNISNNPISPKRSLVYLGSLLFGLLLPFGTIYARNLIDNKVHSKESLEKTVTDIPVLAELPKIGKKQDLLLRSDNRLVLGESLRILRTNLDYLIASRRSKDRKYSNIIFVTSSISGEGKTFVSSNLSIVYAAAHRKVLLLGADIRNPKIYSFFVGEENGEIEVEPKNERGLTDYLINKDIGLKDIITPVSINSNKVDVIYSGKMMPNPAELMLSKRFDELFSRLSDAYDYVIVDTAPLMLVTDTLLISKYASQTIYVMRAGSTDLKVMDYPINLQKEGKINGLSFVVNDVKSANLGYGKKYGYGYGSKQKKWWQIFGT